MEHLRELLSSNVTIIIASHDLNLLAKYCDKVMILSQGEIVAFGRPEEVITAEMVENVYGVEVVILKEGDDIYAIPKRTRRKETKHERGAEGPSRAIEHGQAAARRGRVELRERAGLRLQREPPGRSGASSNEYIVDAART